jgi:NAD-dependent DNA ligase
MNLKKETLKHRIECNTGTKKYKLIDSDCLHMFTRKNIPHKKIEIKLLNNDKVNKSDLKIQSKLSIMNKVYNNDFITLMDQLYTIMSNRGEPFRARAYKKAQETIMAFPENITSTKQLEGKPNIGPTIMEKLNEYVETGTLKVLEREKTNPINILSDIYGVGPKKAQELVESGITTIAELRQRQDELLNDTQKVGLKYYEQIQQRIPRSEIVEFEQMFNTHFSRVNTDGSLEIVGSYRRGAISSGDIDVIITSKTGSVYEMFVSELLKTGIILEVLSRGPSKTLVIASLPNGVARRIDFLYSPPDEFAFAILYFTGSKMFNTAMRQHGLNKGYTFNEHGIYHVVANKKGKKVDRTFTTEKDIFDFLGLEFKTPIERVDTRSVTEISLLSVTDEPVVTNINNFKRDGINVLEQLSETDLNDIIRYANNNYYNNDTQNVLLSDNQYDIIKDYIENKYMGNQVIKEIGAKVNKNKVTLPYHMPSMDKIKPDTGALAKWMTKYNGPYVLSCKLDGVSALYSCEGAEPKLYTRGDGTIGQDITHLIPYFQLPKVRGIVIRGEIIIQKAVFEEKYKTTFANPRNMVAGTINHKHIDEAIVDLDFVAYETIAPNVKVSEQMEFLKSLSIKSVLHQIVNREVLTNEYLSELLVDWRKNYTYEIDGIIVTDNAAVYERKLGNPEHAFAFKMVLSDQMAEAIVTDVLWTPSKDGYLKPRVRIEPIQLCGVTIEYATGFNGAFIRDNKIGIGATIQLIRSGDVIPHITAVTVPAEEGKMPTFSFKWTSTNVDIILENPSEDPIVKQKNIAGFFVGLGVEGLSSGNITRLINAGYDSVPAIIKMTVQDYLKVDGFKDKMANKIYNGIQSKLEEASIIKLMSASNLFGRGLSEKKFIVILTELPDILISDETDAEKVEAIAELKGFSEKTAELFVDKIDEFKEFLEECDLEDKLYEDVVEEKAESSHPLHNKTLVLTGTRDKNIIEFLNLVGANQGSSVNKSTMLVVAKDKDDVTGKVQDARRLNIPIMSVNEFIEMYVNK